MNGSHYEAVRKAILRVVVASDDHRGGHENLLAGDDLRDGLTCCPDLHHFAARVGGYRVAQSHGDIRLAVVHGVKIDRRDRSNDRPVDHHVDGEVGTGLIRQIEREMQLVLILVRF